jgi:hypothetical protein
MRHGDSLDANLGKEYWGASTGSILREAADPLTVVARLTTASLRDTTYPVETFDECHLGDSSTQAPPAAWDSEAG